MTTVDMVQHLQDRIRELKAENNQLKVQVATLQQCVEDVACGTRMTCVVCGNPKPCCCDKGPS